MVKNSDKILIRCPHCNAHLRVTPNKYTQIVCPKCKGQVVLSGNPTDAMKPAVDRWGDEVGSEKGSEVHGFFDYLTRHWSQTHGDRIFPVFFGFLAAVAMSFLKPIIHLRGMGVALGLLLMTWVLATTLYALKRLLAYYVKGERTIDEEASSTLAWVAYSSFGVILFSWLPVLIAESFSPPHGWLTTLIPVLSEPQDRLIALLPHEPAKSPEGAELLIAKGDSEAAVEAVEAGHRTKKRAKTEAESTSAPDDEATAAPGLDAPPYKQRSPAHVAADRQESEKQNQSESTQRVVAEGVGASPQEALKDAFRNAVRQVVGAVVDAETLVKNDELIDDKVLTYSDGFIKSYDEVAGSKKVQSGLHRIKIKANVERRSVVAKLKAVNISVASIDGKGLFSEVVTQLEADHNATAIMNKLFKGFPESVMKVEVVENPKPIDSEENRIQLQYTIGVSFDRQKYDAFVDRIIPTLEKLAIRQGEWDQTAVEGEERQLQSNPLGVAPAYHYPGLLKVSLGEFGKALDPNLTDPRTMWKLDEINFKTQMVVVVNTVRSDRGDRTTWRWFHVIRPEMSETKLKVKIEFLDRISKIVTRDVISPLEYADSGRGPNTDAAFPWYSLDYSFFDFGVLKTPEKPALAVISPDLQFGGGCAFRIDAFFCLYGPRMIVSRKVSFTPKELERIDKIRCSISAQ